MCVLSCTQRTKMQVEIENKCLQSAVSVYSVPRCRGGVSRRRRRLAAPASASRAATALASISLLLAIHLIGYHSCGFIHFADSSGTHF